MALLKIRNETDDGWLEFGAQGNQGDQGATGDTGAQGNQGDAGAQGNQGDTGATGDTGAQGNQGDAGAQGAQGNQGNQGDSAAPAAHDILSAQHGDTLAAGVSQGSIIVGNATPKWAELTIGAANTRLESDGTDIAWQANITLADAATTKFGAATYTWPAAAPTQGLFAQATTVAANAVTLSFVGPVVVSDNEPADLAPGVIWIDTNAAAPIGYWTRDGTDLYPTTAGDAVVIRSAVPATVTTLANDGKITHASTLSGDTTDTIDIGTSTVWYQHVYAQKYYVDAATAYIDLSSTTLRINGPSYIGFYIGGTAYAFVSTTMIYPNVDGGMDLGSAAKSWQSLWLSGNIVIEGTVDGVNVSSHTHDIASHTHRVDRKESPTGETDGHTHTYHHLTFAMGGTAFYTVGASLTTGAPN